MRAKSGKYYYRSGKTDWRPRSCYPVKPWGAALRGADMNEPYSAYDGRLWFKRFQALVRGNEKAPAHSQQLALHKIIQFRLSLARHMSGRLSSSILTKTLFFVAITPSAFAQKIINSTNSTAGKGPAADQYVGYIEEPDGRGTISLVLSCLLTLILCVWSALHLNVPRKHQTAAERFWLNFGWISTGIYAPELVVFTAWRQWSSAKLLTREVAETCSKGAVHGKDHSSWTMVHSFFACTGGFALEIEGLEKVLPKQDGDETQKPRRLTLTARGVAILARCGWLPTATAEEIEDKSKANDLAKATVMVQATWMLVQVMSRLATSLPITLLEVNTVAHILCAFAMYVFWWHKPLLPCEPIVLRDESLLPLAAFMYVSSEISGQVDTESFKSQTAVKTMLAHLNCYSKVPELEYVALQHQCIAGSDFDGSNHCKTGHRVLHNKVPQLDRREHGVSDHEFVRASQDCLSLLRLQKEKESTTAFFERRPRVLHHHRDNTNTSDKDQERWKLLIQALTEYPQLLHHRTNLDHRMGDNRCIHFKTEELLAERVKNWPGDDLLRSVDGLTVGMILWLANFCYGAIHAAAWGEHFASVAEQWLWRISACYIGFCGGLWVVLNFIVSRCKSLNEFWERWMDGEKTWWQSFGLGCLVFVCGFSLMLARVFIVIEAFISIRQLPARAYNTPQWAAVFPHF